MQKGNLGSLGPVSRLTLGGGGLGQLWGRTDRAECVATLRAAVDAGIDLIDLAYRYGQGEAELVFGEAFEGRLPDGASHEYSGFQRVVFDGVVRDYLNMFETEPSKNSLQVRDIGLISAPSVVVHRNLRRIRGMIKPWSGLPKV